MKREKHGSPKLKNNKALGQHWLKDREILDTIAELAMPELEPESELPVCLEIGPGLGTLTSSLLKIYPQVIAVEYDARLAQNLPKSFPGKNLDVWQEDFLQTDLGKLPKNYVVAANIPYYITSQIISKLLKAENRPAKIVLLIQKEVAERIAAGAESETGVYPGKQTQISLLVQNLAKVTLGPAVEKEYFTPPPKVDSQIIVLEPHEPTISENVFKLIRLGFSSPRKKLIKNLIAHRTDLEPAFIKAGIPLDARPGDLTLKNWQDLFFGVEW